MTPESVATKERHGWKLLPKSMFWKHKCETKCRGCRKTFRVCPDDRCFLSHPREIRCVDCSHVANERWLKGHNNELVPCPNCWGLSTCSGMALEGNSAHCRQCAYRWAQAGVPWHKDAVAMGWRDAEVSVKVGYEMEAQL